MGLARAHRLRRSSDFERVRTAGDSWVNRWLVLAALQNDLGRVRVGVSASRRVGGAVERARARRLIREAVRPWLTRIAGGWDLVFVARASVAGAGLREIERAMTDLIRRARLPTEMER